MNEKPLLETKKKYIGVYQERSGSYVCIVSLGRNGYNRKVRKTIGRFLLEEDAALAYDRAAINLKGPDTKLNFPGQDDGRPIVRLRYGDRSAASKRRFRQKVGKLRPSQLDYVRTVANLTYYKDIAPLFGVSTDTICCAVNQVRYKEIL